jgi:hypothetical protein
MRDNAPEYALTPTPSKTEERAANDFGSSYGNLNWNGKCLESRNKVVRDIRIVAWCWSCVSQDRLKKFNVLGFVRCKLSEATADEGREASTLKCGLIELAESFSVESILEVFNTQCELRNPV